MSGATFLPPEIIGWGAERRPILLVCRACSTAWGVRVPYCSRVLEEAGVATVVVSTGRDLSAQVKAPRTVFVNIPRGNPFGRSFDTAQQRMILLDALHALESVDVGGELIDLSYDWGEEFGMNLGPGYRAKVA